MSYLLEILGRGFLAELAAAFRELLQDDQQVSTAQLEQDAAGPDADVDAWRTLGIRRLADHQFSAARDAFGEALTIDPRNQVCRLGTACALDELGFTRQAIRELRVTLQADSEAPGTWFALGFCLEKLGDTHEAIKAYELSLDLAPQLRNAHERLAAIYLKLDDVGMAITHYEHLSWCEPGDLSANMALASLYLRTKRYDEAIQRFEYVITIDPDNWEARDDLVTACVEAGKYDDAISRLQDLIERRPDCADQHLQLGDVYAKLHRHPQAIAAYSHAVQLNPDYLEATVKVGTAQFRSGHFTEAARAFNRAIEINDRILSAYVGLAVAQQALGRTEHAQATLEMAAEVEPNSTLLFAEIARLQLQVTAAAQVDKYLSASAVATSAVRRVDDDVAMMVGQQVENIRSALRQHPNHPDLHYRLGLLLRYQGDLPGAIDAYLASVSINPQYLKAMTKLGLAQREVGRLEEASTTLRRALSLDPESVELHYQLGLTFADRNEFALALDRFEYSANHEPHNLDYVANVALALQNMGLADRAEAGWQTLCDVALETSQMPEGVERLRG